MSNTSEIAETNKAICEFLGWEFREDPKFEFMAYFEGEQMWCDNLRGLNRMLLEGFNYHEKWDKLIPVWKTWIVVADEYNEFMQYKDYHRIFHNCIDNNDIKAAHETISEAIKWIKARTNANRKTT